MARRMMRRAKQNQALNKRRRLSLPLLALLTLTCGGPKGGDSARKPASDGDVEISQSPLINPNRGPDGRGPLQNFEHVRSNTAPVEPYYVTSGTLEGSSGVLDGSYSYTLPINLPEGVAGLKPKLALEYSSGGANGPIGVGWSLSGTSRIVRCKHTASRDGFATGFDDNSEGYNTALNQYCLDGNKLVALQVRQNEVVYQTESADFSDIHGFFTTDNPRDPAYFVVTARDGRIYTYGGVLGESATANARADSPSGGVNTRLGTLTTYAWHLSKVQDRDSNQMLYFYEVDPSSRTNNNFPDDWPGSTRYLSAIKYGNTWVRLTYEDRPDPIDAFAFGFDVSVRKRLARITINTRVEAPRPTWRYDLAYSQSAFTSRSELTSVKLTDQFGFELPRTTFRWNSPSSGTAFDTFHYRTSAYPIGNNCGTSCFSGISCDWFSCGGTWYTPRSTTRVMLADVNGDGRDDALYVRKAQPDSNPVLVTRLGTADGLGPEIEAVAEDGGFGPPRSLDGAVAADFDGDGKVELIAPHLHRYYDVGHGDELAYDVVRWDGSRLFVYSHWDAEQNGVLGQKVLRITRDLYPDFGTTEESEVGTNFFVTYDPNRLGDPRALRVADFNGDGIPDLVGGTTDPDLYQPSIDPFAPQAIFLGRRSNSSKPLNFRESAIHGPPPDGAPLNPAPPTTRPAWPWLPPLEPRKAKTVYIGDLDGDGRADVVRRDLNTKGLLFVDMNGDGSSDELDWSAMENQADCGGTAVQLLMKLSTGRLGGTTRDQVITSNLSVPGGRGTCVNQATQGSRVAGGTATIRLDAEYASSVRVGDFNGDGRQDLLLLNAGLDAGEAHVDTSNDFADKGPEWSQCMDFGCGNEWYFNYFHRMPSSKGHFSPPVLLMSTATATGTQFVPVVMPVRGGRLREEHFTWDEKWKKVESGNPHPGEHFVSTGSWNTHYWEGTAVGDIDGDGLSDIAQLVRAPDSNTVWLEVITAKKAELGVLQRKDVIVAVGNGLMAQRNGNSYEERISYAELPTLADQGRYARENCVPGEAPARTSCHTRGLVVDHLTPAGGNWSWIEYSYESSRFDRGGRGSLGFDAVTSLDMLNGKRTVSRRSLALHEMTIPDRFGFTAYAQRTLALSSDEHYPRYVAWDVSGDDSLGGYAQWAESKETEVTQTQHLAWSGADTPVPLRRNLTTTTNELLTNVPNSTAGIAPNAFLTRPKHVEGSEIYIAQAADASATAAPDITTSTDYVYDEFSNRKLVTSSTSPGGFREVVDTKYDNNTTQWLLGQRRHVEHTRTVPTEAVIRTTDYTYYPTTGHLDTVTVEPVGDSDVKTTTKHTYYGNGNLETVSVSGIDRAISDTQLQTRTTRYAYDANGIYPTLITDPLGQQTSISYDAPLGVPISIVDANGLGVEFVYDGFGRRRGVFPDVGQATFTTIAADLNEADVGYRASSWRSFGSLTTGLCSNAPPGVSLTVNGRCFTEVAQNVINPKGQTFIKSTRALDGTWQDSAISYNSRDQLATETAPVARNTPAPTPTQYFYDGLDRPTYVINPDTTRRTWQYPSRFLTITTDEAGATVSHTVDSIGQQTVTVETVTDQSGSHGVMTSLLYGAFGNPTQSIRMGAVGAPRTTRFGYDVLGRLTTNDDPATGLLTKRYNAFGEPRQEIDGLSTRNLKHDGLGRLLRREDASSPTSKFESFTWDTAPGSALGKLASATSQPDNVTQAYEYNSKGQLYKRILTAPGGTYTMFFYYDDEGRPWKTFYPKPPTSPSNYLKTINTYDGFGRLIEVGTYQPTTMSLWKLNSATPLRTFETFGDGSTDERLLDPVMRRLTDIKMAANGATRNLQYTYYPDGNVATYNNANTTEGYSYDELDRLTKWTRSTAVGTLRREYSYNDFGDLTGTKTFNAITGGTQTAAETYTLGVITPRNMPSAVSSDGVNTYAYDLLGRRRTKTTPGGPGAETTTYNQWNLPANIGSPAGTMTAAYDAFGIRAVKTFNLETTYYMDDIFEDRVANDGTRTYVMHIKAGRRTVAEVSQVASSGSGSITPSYIHQDRLGSTRFVTTPTAITPFFYEPFGMRVNSLGQPPVAMDLTAHHDFTGQERDSFGLINMKGRMYDPALRRFLSPDPVIARPLRSQGYNPYSYVRNNPSNLIDPTGFAPPDGPAPPPNSEPMVGNGPGAVGEGDDDLYCADNWTACNQPHQGGSGGNRTAHEPSPRSDPYTEGVQDLYVEPDASTNICDARYFAQMAPDARTPAPSYGPTIEALQEAKAAAAPGRPLPAPHEEDVSPEGGICFDGQCSDSPACDQEEEEEEEARYDFSLPTIRAVTKFSANAGVGANAQAGVSAVDVSRMNGSNSGQHYWYDQLSVGGAVKTKGLALSFRGGFVVNFDDVSKLKGPAITIGVYSAELLFDPDGHLRGILFGPGAGFNYTANVKSQVFNASENFPGRK